MDRHEIVVHYKSLAESALDESNQDLLSAAREALNSAYAPYSGFAVGAALRLVDGSIVKGSNQENASYPNGICAERVAMFAAAALHPNVSFETLAIVTNGDKPVASCGICRQSIVEYSNVLQPFGLLLGTQDGAVLMFEDAAQLLPLAFTKEDLAT